jgi:hypothetical protein
MMSLKTIKYSQRLGDILRCLPAAKFLAEQGHEVFFDCQAQYQGVFEMTSYVKAGHNQGEILDLEIWPDKYEAFIKSKKPWHDFVYSHPEIKGAKRTEIVLDLLDERPADGLPEKYHLIAPFGISQSHKHNPLEIIQMAAKELGKDNITVLCPPEVRIEGLKTYTAPTIEQLAKAVRGADEFWAINSAPIILASAVRHGKESKFWGEQGDSEVQNVFWFEGLFRMD